MGALNWVFVIPRGETDVGSRWTLKPSLSRVCLLFGNISGITVVFQYQRYELICELLISFIDGNILICGIYWPPRDRKWGYNLNRGRNLYTQGNIFEILWNQTEIRLYLPFSEWFGIKRTSVWFQMNRKMVNTIWFRFDFLRFRKDLSVCNWVFEDVKSFLHTKDCNAASS